MRPLPLIRYFLADTSHLTAFRAFAITAFVYAVLHFSGVLPVPLRDNRGYLIVIVLLFSIVASAGVVPESLQKGRIELLLSRPHARRFAMLSIASALSAIVWVCSNLLALLLWLAHGLKTGEWPLEFLAQGTILWLSFIPILGFILLLGVLTRNTGTVIVALTGYVVFLSPVLERENTAIDFVASPIGSVMIILSYCLPRPITGIYFNVSKAFGSSSLELLPLVSSLAAGVIAFLVSQYVFRKLDF